jgi:predicted transcriptional regulator
MKSPCEEIVWDVLPSIRAAIAEELIKRGISQKEVSKMLGITPPAVSQYVSKKRGYNIEFREDIRGAIGKLADDLIEKKADDLAKRICEICRMLQDDENACISSRCKEQ